MGRGPRRTAALHVVGERDVPLLQRGVTVVSQLPAAGRGAWPRASATGQASELVLKNRGRAGTVAVSRHARPVGRHRIALLVYLLICRTRPWKINKTTVARQQRWGSARGLGEWDRF